MKTALVGFALVAIALAPTVLSSGWYTNSQTVVVTGTSPVRMMAHDYEFFALSGDYISAHVDFTTNQGDVDLVLIPPGGSCALDPMDALLTADCVSSTTMRRLNDPTCANGNRHPLQIRASGSEDESTYAAASGMWKVSVQFPNGVLATRYTLWIEGPDSLSVNGPISTSYVASNPACRV